MLRLRLVATVIALAFVCAPWVTGQQYVASTIAGPGVVPGTTITTGTTTTTATGIGDSGPATSGYLQAPVGVSWVNGNIFVLENGGCRVRQITGGTITTAAGIGATTAPGTTTPTAIVGYSGDGGLASLATLNYPQGMAVDASANIYVADTMNFVIRKFQVGGNISTIAGNGFSGYGADGVTAITSQLLLPHAVALDSASNLYIADGNRIRKISGGNIATIAGGVNPGFAGDGGPATAALFNNPQGLTVDAAGNVYVADTFNQRVRKIAANGIVTTVLGTGVAGSSGDGGLALNAQVEAPTGVVMDSTGAMYVAEHNRVRKVFPNQVITTVAGTGVDGYSGDGGLATGAQLMVAYGLGIDPSGNIYIADSGNNVVRMIAPVPGGTITNAASNLPAAVAPGEIMTIYGTGLGTDPISYATIDTTVNPQGLIDTTLNGLQVNFDGFPAPVLYQSGKQVAVIAPYEIAGVGSAVAIQVINNSVTTSAFSAPLAASAPEVFSANGSGVGQAAVLNQNGTLNSATNPATAGSAVVLYATGEGITTPGGVDGLIANAAAGLPKPVAAVTVTVGGVSTPVEYAGAAPGEVAGLLQVNIRLPQSGLGSGNLPVKITVGNSTSQGSVTIAVK